MRHIPLCMPHFKITARNELVIINHYLGNQVFIWKLINIG
jgi:hypothetical protein